MAVVVTAVAVADVQADGNRRTHSSSGAPIGNGGEASRFGLTREARRRAWQKRLYRESLALALASSPRQRAEARRFAPTAYELTA